MKYLGLWETNGSPNLSRTTKANININQQEKKMAWKRRRRNCRQEEERDHLDHNTARILPGDSKRLVVTQNSMKNCQSKPVWIICMEWNNNAENIKQGKTKEKKNENRSYKSNKNNYKDSSTGVRVRRIHLLHLCRGVRSSQWVSFKWH